MTGYLTWKHELSDIFTHNIWNYLKKPEPNFGYWSVLNLAVRKIKFRKQQPNQSVYTGMVSKHVESKNQKKNQNIRTETKPKTNSQANTNLPNGLNS